MSRDSGKLQTLNRNIMAETKKYEVVEEVTIDEVSHAAGEVIELTDEKAEELGESVKAVEE